MFLGNVTPLFVRDERSNKMRASSFETSASVNPAKQLHIPADLNLEIANQLTNFLKESDIGKLQ